MICIVFSKLLQCPSFEQWEQRKYPPHTHTQTNAQFHGFPISVEIFISSHWKYTPSFFAFCLGAQTDSTSMADMCIKHSKRSAETEASEFDTAASSCGEHVTDTSNTGCELRVSARCARPALKILMTLHPQQSPCRALCVLRFVKPSIVVFYSSESAFSSVLTDAPEKQTVCSNAGFRSGDSLWKTPLDDKRTLWWEKTGPTK